MRERRRLRLAQRQKLLATIARREAMGALAGSLDEEAKSEALAERSRDMAKGYSERHAVISGEDLRALGLMASGLSQLAGEAENAREDARKQSHWQVQALASAETRLQRMQELEAEARLSLNRVRDNREAAAAFGDRPMARKLQRRVHNPDHENQGPVE